MCCMVKLEVMVMMADELLDMKLNDISDLFLDKLSTDDTNCVKVDLPGHCKNERFVLRVCLCKGDGLK